MRYIPQTIQKDLDALHATHVHDIGDFGVFQWHKEDETLVAEADCDVIGVYYPEDKVFQVWDTDERILGVEPDVVESLTRLLAEKTGMVRFLAEDHNYYYAARNFQVIETPCSFQDEIAHLRQLFIDCMVGLENHKEGSYEHIALVHGFQAKFEDFLDRYKQQSIETFATYITELSVPYDRAIQDITLISSLYT